MIISIRRQIDPGGESMSRSCHQTIPTLVAAHLPWISELVVWELRSAFGLVKCFSKWRDGTNASCCHRMSHDAVRDEYLLSSCLTYTFVALIKHVYRMQGKGYHMCIFKLQTV